MGFTSDACWFLLIKMLLIKNNKKREAALKNEAGGDEKPVVFFTWPYTAEYIGEVWMKVFHFCNLTYLMKALLSLLRLPMHSFSYYYL